MSVQRMTTRLLSPAYNSKAVDVHTPLRCHWKSYSTRHARNVARKGCLHGQVELDTMNGREIVDITQDILQILESWQPKAKDGILTVSSMHTTCAIVVNENEHYLKQDILEYIDHVVPKDGPHGKGYGHNVLEKRPATDRDREAIVRNKYGGFSSVEEFMAQEPINAHAHIQSMLLGNSVTVGVEHGCIRLVSWQSIMFVELDGPRKKRRASVTLVY